MSNPTFIHLRIHTEYSLIDGIVRIDELMSCIATYQMPAVAITDFCNLFATVKFYRTAIAAGIKPIFGVDIAIHNPRDAKQPTLATLFAQNIQGYRNITRLISRAYIEGQANGIPLIQIDWLKDYTEGVIAISGGRHGDIGQAISSENTELSRQLLQDWLQLFPDRFYLEIQRLGQAQEEEHLAATLALAEQFNVPVVATNDVRFLNQDDYEAHEARVCIHRGEVLTDPKRQRRYTEQQFLKSAEEMQELFKDIPEALENTIQIAKRCNVKLKLEEVFLPNFAVPSEFTIESYLEHLAKEGLAERLKFINHVDTISKETYLERIETELRVINSMGFAGYFLIVADFIQWAKQHGIPVGPGRGSGAGSLVAYALKITDLDPLPYDLLFERFLNPERVSMPDFDIDFCVYGRDRVIDYVANKYGKQSVSQIITFGTMAAKAVVRDVGRVLGMSYGFVDKLAKLIPFELGMTLDRALEQEEQLTRLYNEEEEVKTLIDLALKLEGITRNAGKHAGGVVIAPSELTDFTPLYCEEGSDHYVTQFDKDDVEAIGLVKFDFLGLRNLTIIDWTLQIVNTKKRDNNEPIIDINTIPLHDVETFELLKACKTTAVFQLESRGMKDLIKRLQPDCFEDIVALVALFRPGPLQSGMVDDFIDRKHGRAKVEYPHPDLEPILRPTYGIILYQEQVMQIAQVLAGYSLGSADLLRRAMGKKKPEEMAKQRATFIDGAAARGVNKQKANSIFDLMEKFAGYGFNKSHSAAYALVSYQTAWLKTRYPAEFMAAVLSSDMEHTDKVVHFINECKNMNLKVLAPDINQGLYRFAVNPAGEIMYGLGAIKGVGESAIQMVVDERKQNGKYRDLFDFCQRIDPHKTNRRMMEALVRAGALDKLGPHRGAIFATLSAAIQQAEQSHLNQQLGQHDLFGSITSTATKASYDFAEIAPWGSTQLLQGEKETLGHYFSGHPLQRYQTEYKALSVQSIAELNPDKSQSILIAGVVVAIRIMHTKRGDRMGFLTLEDESGRIEIAVFPEIFKESRDLLVKDTILLVEGEVSVDDYTGGYKVSCKRISSMLEMRSRYAKQLLLKLKSHRVDDVFLQKLAKSLKPFLGGKCPVSVEYHQEHSLARIQLGEQWRVHLVDELFENLEQLTGEENFLVEY